MKARLKAALTEREEIDRRAEVGTVAPAVALHPNLAEAYRRNVEKITAALNAPELEAGEARQALRNLIELIMAEPRAEGKGLDLLVHGRLAQILHIANGHPDLRQDGRLKTMGSNAPIGAEHTTGGEAVDCMFNVVAGTGFEPVTFRL